MLYYLVNSLVDKAVDMVVIGGFLVHGKLINCVRGFQNAVSKTVRQVKSRQTPYLR